MFRTDPFGLESLGAIERLVGQIEKRLQAQRRSASPKCRSPAPKRFRQARSNHFSLERRYDWERPRVIRGCCPGAASGCLDLRVRLSRAKRRIYRRTKTKETRW